MDIIEIDKCMHEILDNRLVIESVTFADYKFLARYMSEYKYYVMFDCSACKIRISSSRNSVTLRREDDYYCVCLCGEILKEHQNDVLSLQSIIDKLKNVFNFELIKEDEILKKWCAKTSWNEKIPDNEIHTHYLYRLTYKTENNNNE